MSAEPSPSELAGLAALELRQALNLNGSHPHPASIQAVGSTFDLIEPQVIDWEWEGVIATGHYGEINGEPGAGKSLLTCEIAARRSTGRQLPGGSPSDPTGIVILNYEDDPGSVLRARLEAAGADLSRVFCLQGVRTPTDEESRDLVLPNDLEAVADAVERVGASLVMVDPILTALDPSIDTHKDADVKRALRPLTQFAQERNVAILSVRHPNKSLGRAINRPGGSIGLTGTARLSSLLSPDPDDPDRRILSPIKSNLGVRHPAWSFRITTHANGAAFLQWDETPRNMTADDVLTAGQADDEERTQIAEASDWLRDFICSPKLVKEIRAESDAAGFAWRTVERAKVRLGAKSSKHGFSRQGVWTWCLPDHEVDDDA